MKSVKVVMKLANSVFYMKLCSIQQRKTVGSCCYLNIFKIGDFFTPCKLCFHCELFPKFYHIWQICIVDGIWLLLLTLLENVTHVASPAFYQNKPNFQTEAFSSGLQMLAEQATDRWVFESNSHWVLRPSVADPGAHAQWSHCSGETLATGKTTVLLVCTANHSSAFRLSRSVSTRDAEMKYQQIRILPFWIGNMFPSLRCLMLFVSVSVCVCVCVF